MRLGRLGRGRLSKSTILQSYGMLPQSMKNLINLQSISLKKGRGISFMQPIYELNIYVILGFFAALITGPFVIVILFLLFRFMMLIIVQVVALLFGKKSRRTTKRKRLIRGRLHEFGKTHAKVIPSKF